MDSTTKWLTNPDAADYPSPYQIGNQLKSPTKNIQGPVRNAKYVGPKSKAAPTWITYYLETENGQISTTSPKRIREDRCLLIS